MNTLETAYLHEQRGALAFAVNAYMQALITATPEAKPHVMMGLARVFYETNRLQECANALKTAAEADNLPIKLEAELLHARLLRANGDYHGAIRRMGEAVCHALQMNDRAAQLYAQSHEARLQRRAEQPSTYYIWATRAIIPKNTPFPWRVTILFNQVRAAVAAKENLLRAGGIINNLLPQLDDYIGLRVEGLILHAVELEARGRLERALLVLAEAIRLAAPRGYLRVFLDEGAPVARMLYELNLRRVSPEYVPRVLSSFRAA